VSDATDPITQSRLVPVVVLDDPAGAAPLGAALLAGGLNCVEVTFRTDAAAESLRILAEDASLLVGAGTVVTTAQVNQAVSAGARFVVSPGFSPTVVRHCQEVGIPVFPGVATATEIQQALELDITTVKFFPAGQLGGPGMVKALSAPFRNVRFIPTGGVTTANLADYLAIPAVAAVGGTWMVAPDLLKAGNWDEVTRRTAEAVAAVKSIDGGSSDA
jgi:2-dehydro-3-deoxyphosphogluconate aldolase / (4S)-4-hydroxy-2-oxoglutarate aldolase